MFNKLKQIKDLRDQAKTMQSMLSKESVTIERSGITLVMNGNLEITSLVIAEQLDKDKLAKEMKEAVNDAVKKIQRIMASKMQEMGGLGNFGM
jgi:DNA-binding protein YbaB